MELYIIINDKGNIVGDKAYVNLILAKQQCIDLKCYGNYKSKKFYPELVSIDDSKCPVGRHIYFAHVYKGFDYGWESMYDVVKRDNTIFTCKADLKAGKFWSKYLSLTKGKENEFNFYDDKICSKDDYSDGDWFYGDVMDNKFYMEINKLRVNKTMEG